MGRDYVAEMRRLIDAETAEGPYIPMVVAEHVVKKLRVVDPDLLRGWLAAQAVEFLRRMIVERDRSQRGRIARVAKRSEFADAVAAANAGDQHGLAGFLDMPYPVGEGVHKRLAELTAADLRYVADQYDRRASENAMVAAFLRVLAKTVGPGTVGERYTEEQLTRLWINRAEHLP